MPQQLFLSHDSRDHVLATALGSALKRLTLNQISVWHSSDGSRHGGLKPGQVWLDEIRTQLSRSKAVVTLLTPRSVATPWLLFESGFGAANIDCDVIPVCVGIDSLTSVPYPLGMYQTYQLVDYDSVKRFAEKLLGKYEVSFDEEMCKPVLVDLIRKIVDEPGVRPEEKQPSSSKPVEAALNEIKAHIDKRILEVISRGAAPEQKMPRSQPFSISLDLTAFTPDSKKQFLEISSEMSVQDVLDAVYYVIPRMTAFKYLIRWMLRDSSAGLNLVLGEVGTRIPAHVVFLPGSHWEVVKLLKPYSPDDSRDTGRWYGQR